MGDILANRHSSCPDRTISTDRLIRSGVHTSWVRGCSTTRAGCRPRLDLVFLAAALAIFGQVSDPDVLFHVIWVVLTLQAFLFGLRVSIARIVIAGILLVTYFNLGALDEPGGLEFAALDLAEWPLMIVIAVIVAVMADRLSSTTRHYAELYRRASDSLLTAQESERQPARPGPPRRGRARRSPPRC